MNRLTNILAGVLPATCTTLVVAMALTLVVSSRAAAQWNVERFGVDRNHVYTTVGLDPAMVTSVGYGRVVSFLGRPVQLTGDAGVVTARLDARDFRVRLGTQGTLVRWQSLHLTGSATAVTRGTENSVYRGINFGADLTGTLGVYRPRWFAASEFGFDKAIITHVTHSDWYRSHYYPDARDGWYLDAGGTYHYGATGGITLGKAEVMGRFGWRRTERYQTVTPPIFASVGLGFGF